MNKINEEIAKITDSMIDLQLGMLFNQASERLSPDGDIPVPSNFPGDKFDRSKDAIFLSLFRWIYGHVSGKKKYLHTYE